MKHAFIDKYAYRDSVIHRLNSSVKVALALGLMVGVVIISGLVQVQPYTGWIYVCYTGFLIIVILLSKVPIWAILKKVAIILPFILVIVGLNFLVRGLGYYALYLIVKSFLCILTLVILISTTKFHAILNVLSAWRVPKVILLTLSFMYRYFFLLIDELEKMTRAFRVRYLGKSRWRILKLMSVIIGTLFIRSYERAERVYYAMVMRGYTGEEM